MTLDGKEIRSGDNYWDILNHCLNDYVTFEVTSDPEGLGKLAVFGGVKDFPTRVKCATLPWRALEVILQEVDEQE